MKILDKIESALEDGLILIAYLRLAPLDYKLYGNLLADLALEATWVGSRPEAMEYQVVEPAMDVVRAFCCEQASLDDLKRAAEKVWNAWYETHPHTIEHEVLYTAGYATAIGTDGKPIKDAAFNVAYHSSRVHMVAYKPSWKLAEWRLREWIREFIRSKKD